MQKGGGHSSCSVSKSDIRLLLPVFVSLHDYLYIVDDSRAKTDQKTASIKSMSTLWSLCLRFHPGSW